MYRVDKPFQPLAGRWSLLVGKIVLVVAGSLIGLCAGLYVAAKTLPVPNTTVYYIYR